MTAAVYMGLQAQASVQERSLDSFAPSGAAVAGISHTLRNDGPVPIVVVLVSQPPDVLISAPYL
ncbi:MAG: hypothetical protein Q9O62_09995 [Ardenticatenia bacterium]|nr:hypothetical protein [Ardenticatenia bacterium]